MVITRYGNHVFMSLSQSTCDPVLLSGCEKSNIDFDISDQDKQKWRNELLAKTKGSLTNSDFVLLQACTSYLVMFGEDMVAACTAKFLESLDPDYEECSTESDDSLDDTSDDMIEEKKVTKPPLKKHKTNFNECSHNPLIDKCDFCAYKQQFI